MRKIKQMCKILKVICFLSFLLFFKKKYRNCFCMFMLSAVLYLHSNVTCHHYTLTLLSSLPLFFLLTKAREFVRPFPSSHELLNVTFLGFEEAFLPLKKRTFFRRFFFSSVRNSDYSTEVKDIDKLIFRFEFNAVDFFLSFLIWWQVLCIGLAFPSSRRFRLATE